MTNQHLLEATNCLRLAQGVLQEAGQVHSGALQKAVVPAAVDEARRLIRAAELSLNKA